MKALILAVSFISLSIVAAREAMLSKNTSQVQPATPVWYTVRIVSIRSLSTEPPELLQAP